MSKTKDKILNSARSLFNQRGVSDVTLRDIAEKVGISIGNLAYHYKNKDFMIAELFDKMEEEKTEILSGVQQIPSFENIDNQVAPLLNISKRYRFFFLDTMQILRNYPLIAEKHQTYIDNSIKYVKAVLDYSVGSGNMEPEREKGLYWRLATMGWMNIYFWPAQMAICGKEDPTMVDVKNTMWDVIKPYLTEKGRANFDKSITNKHEHASS